jgi:glycosyltransferase involved in cell wall biosynthesis
LCDRRATINYYFKDQVVMYKMKIILVLPTYNEIDGLRAVFPLIDRALFDDVLLIDGGSTDGTLEYAFEQGLTVVSQIRPGLAFAIYDIISAHEDVDYVVEFSPDGNCIPALLPEMIGHMQDGCDLIVASRYLGPAQSFDDNLVSGFGNWLFTQAFRFMGRGQVTDSLNIYRGFRADILRDPLFEPLLSGPVFEPLVTGICQLRGYNIREISGDEPERIGGETKRSIIYNGSCILWLVLRLYIHKLIEMTTPGRHRALPPIVAKPAPVPENLLPKITLVVPVYNAVHMVATALESIASQQYPRLELFVLDGGSTDGSQAIIANYDHIITETRSNPDKGAVFAIAAGLSMATGDILGVVSADDWLEPGALDAIGREFQSDPALEVLTGGVRFLCARSDGTSLITEEVINDNMLSLTLDNVVARPLTHARFLKAECYNKLGVYNTEYLTSSDLDFLIRLAMSEPKHRTIPDIIYNFRQHNGSASMGNSKARSILMLSDNLKILGDYLNRPLDAYSERVLVRFFGRYSLRLAIAVLLSGQMQRAVSNILLAYRYNRLFLMEFPRYLYRRAGKLSFSRLFNRCG